MKFAKTSTAIVATAAAALVPVTPALSRPPKIVVTAPIDAVSRHISYADLNLASEQGERTLTGRVDAGVNGLCNDGAGGNDGSLTYKTYMLRCSGGAWNQARPQIALAVQRAREIAAIGTSSITAAALTISLPK